jgi:hypothetical protein
MNNKYLDYTLISISFVISFLNVSAQLKPGFDAAECRDMIALCNSYTFLEFYGDDSEIIPEGYEKIYHSEAIGMDNMYQLFRKGDIAVICFRGSTDKKISWQENYHAAMVPALGKISGDLGEMTYCFAKSEGATVHSGYALAIAFMADDLRTELLKLHDQGVNDLLITGHSQGGALANLLMALLENHINDTALVKNRYKTYAFAAPMVGNTMFVDEYNNRYCETNHSFNIVNPTDPIPKLPITFNDSITISNYLKSLHPDKHSISLKLLLKEFVKKDVQDFATSRVHNLSKSMRKKITKELGVHVKFPDFANNIDYKYVGNRIELNPFDYPKTHADSTELNNMSSKKDLSRGKERRLEKRYNKKRGNVGFQHKPYNYYVGFLKDYLKHEYKELEKKYLPENL